LGNADRAAQYATELVLPQAVLFTQRGARGVEVILKIVGGVENIVAEELECRAVELLRARFQDDSELRAGVGSVLSRIAAGLDLELLHRFNRWSERHGVDAGFGGFHAVECGVLVSVALPVGADGNADAGNGNASAGAGQAVKSHAAAELNARLQH